MRSPYSLSVERRMCDEAHQHRQHDIWQAPKRNSEVNKVIDLNEVRVTPRDPGRARRRRAKKGSSRNRRGSLHRNRWALLFSSLNIGDYDAGDSGFQQAPFVQFSAKAFHVGAARS
jgi:hypothetical protein